MPKTSASIYMRLYDQWQWGWKLKINPVDTT